MKAVMVEVPEHILEARQRTGADQWDELWNGVLHMPPMPNYSHQKLESELEVYLKLFWARPNKSEVLHQINLASIGGWPSDYRIPDLVLVSAERADINHGEYFEGAPDAVVEIFSPGDETYDKLPFYEELGVPEVWIIHRDTKAPEIHLLKRGKLKKQKPTSEGWLRSPGIGIEMKKGKGKLLIRLTGDDSTCERLPED